MPCRPLIFAVSPMLCVLLLTVPGGCEAHEPPRDAPPPAAAAEPSPWRGDAVSRHVPIDSDDESALRDAIAQAQATADQARLRWMANGSERQHWAVKWAAPTVGGGVEHVWVEPAHWSPFRIEAVLITLPTMPLEGDHAPGDLVSFPIEELSDWLYMPGGDLAAREGGFTIDVLEERFGRPH